MFVSVTEAVISAAGTFSEACLCSHLGRVGLIQSSVCARGCSLVGRVGGLELEGLQLEPSTGQSFFCGVPETTLLAGGLELKG